jgi:hypothetical protein
VGVNLLFEDEHPGGLVHLGKGGLLHPTVAAKLLRTDTTPATDIIWWEVSIEAVGEALGYTHLSTALLHRPLLPLGRPDDHHD